MDTSAWIDFFRGSGPCAALVDRLLETDDATLCGPVLTELRRGLNREPARRRVLDLLSGCPLLSPPPRLWEDAGDLGALLSRRGATVKTLDLLIATYALAHSVDILSGDRDFDRMRRAGVDLMLINPD